MSALGDVIDVRYWDAWLADDAMDRAVENPQPGDRFHEIFSAWLYVVGRVGDAVVAHEFGGHPSEYDAQAVRIETRLYSPAGLRRHLAYKGRPGYWMRYCDRDGPRLEVAT